MTRMTLKARVDAVGVLHVPLGADEANRDVQVTIEPLASKKAMTQEEWAAWVHSMAGSITDPNYRRHDQGHLQEREAL